MPSPKAHLNGSEKTESKAAPVKLPPRWTLVQHTSLSAAVYTNAEGDSEVRYSLHKMDMPSRRMIPTLLGVGVNPCRHSLCHLAQAIGLASEQSATIGSAPQSDDTHLASGQVQLPLM